MSVKTNRFWDRVSRLSRGGTDKTGPTARATVRTALEQLGGESRVLDLGCGPGVLTLELSCGVASVLGVDPSPGMVETARSRLARCGGGNVTFTCGDLATLQGRTDAFDAVMAFNVLPYLEDVSDAARRVAALLPSGGLFLSATACLGERTSFASVAMRVLTRLRIVPPMHFFSLADLTGQIAQAGFRIVETRNLSRLPEYFVIARKI